MSKAIILTNDDAIIYYDIIHYYDYLAGSWNGCFLFYKQIKSSMIRKIDSNHSCKIFNSKAFACIIHCVKQYVIGMELIGPAFWFHWVCRLSSIKRITIEYSFLRHIEEKPLLLKISCEKYYSNGKLIEK